MQEAPIVFDLADVEAACGPTFYQRGRNYWRQQRVEGLTRMPKDPDGWTALVVGTSPYRVNVWCPDGYLDGQPGSCTCPAFADLGVCKHIAAVLIALHDAHGSRLPKTSKPPVDLRMFHTLVNALHIPTETKKAAQWLQTHYVVHAVNSNHQVGFAIEMRVGVERLYIVAKIREFLENVERRSKHTFTKKFTYTPGEHHFHEFDQEMVNILNEARRLEALYHRSTGYGMPASYMRYYYSYDASRALFIPSVLWDRLEPLLVERRAQWGDSPDYLMATDDPLPQQFRLAEDKDGSYNLSFAKIEPLTFYPDYGRVGYGALLHRLDPGRVRQLMQIYALPSKTKTVSVPIAPDILPEAMAELVPVLETLGTVRVDDRIQTRVRRLPAKPIVYLDWRDDGLEARLEFRYGDIKVAPGVEVANEETILIRDRDTETHVLNEFHQVGFEGQAVLLMRNADDIYAFLEDTLPNWKIRMEVYVSDALDPVVATQWQPKMRADIRHETDWLAVDFDFGDLSDQEIRGVLASLKERRRYHRLKDGTFLPLDKAQTDEMGALLADWDIDLKRIKKGHVELPILEALPLMDLENKHMQWGRALRHWLDTLRHPDNVEASVPEDLHATLRPYQVAGFQWMAMLSSIGLGGILADDMGLGKTLQSIAYLAWARSRDSWNPEHPALIVCPASLIYNWEDEFQRFAPHLATRVVAGTQDERRTMQQDLTGVDVLITSYPLLRRDQAWYHDRPFHAVIFDEAQAMKNAATQIAQAALKIQSPHRFALTGTPMENALDDLWSIFRTVSPGLLGSHEKFSQLNPEQVAKRVKPFILRRLKSDVLTELPDKIESVHQVAMTREQKAVYLGYLEQIQSSTLTDLAQQGFQKSRMKILAGLTRLRQICCDPGLFLDNYGGGSGKMEMLLEVVEEALAAHRRILVFSQFTSMLGRIRQAFEERSWSSFYLDGETPVADRLKLVQQFNAGERSIFLISLKAGGTGLNLTGADTVILYDLWWNPAVEQQAIDRAHRIGQKNVVQVIRLITQGTVEDKIYALQQKKRDLIDQVVDANSDGLTSLTESDMREILGIQKPSLAPG